MHTIKRLRDLEKYGIISLTGESCRLGLRILCDLTAAGCKIVEECFGLTSSTSFASRWNHGTNDNDPHVASIMLPYDSWEHLGVFALLNVDDVQEIRVVSSPEGRLLAHREIIGFDSTDGDKLMTDMHEHWHRYNYYVRRISKQDGRTRNEHQMSGRIN